MLNPINYFFNPAKEQTEKFFAFLLNEEFSKDLEAAAFFMSIPEGERNNFERKRIDMLQRKFNRRPPHYEFISKGLRKQYNQLEKEIKEVLYN